MAIQFEEQLIAQQRNPCPITTAIHRWITPGGGTRWKSVDAECDPFGRCERLSLLSTSLVECVSPRKPRPRRPESRIACVNDDSHALATFIEERRDEVAVHNCKQAATPSRTRVRVGRPLTAAAVHVRASDFLPADA